MNDYVIKSLTPEHGAKIIQHFKDRGIDTEGLTGTNCEGNGDTWSYYGTIKGGFDNYSLNQVKYTNTPIKTLEDFETKSDWVKWDKPKEMMVWHTHHSSKHKLMVHGMIGSLYLVQTSVLGEMSYVTFANAEEYLPEVEVNHSQAIEILALELGVKPEQIKII